MKKNDVAIIMGSSSDLPSMQNAIDLFNEFNISHTVKVVSAHRTPEEMIEFGKTAQEKGFKVIIAAAGGAAHLPGMVASVTTLPVIGVPVNCTGLNGMDSLLSIVQMPKGVPVATMAIDNSTNAALFAARILGLSSERIAKLNTEYLEGLKDKVAKMNADLN